jgi:phytoene dehydrogenase-like protein
MNQPSKQSRYDVVVVGGGHNGLVAAAYLARAGLSVLILERLASTGGAVSSEELFPGMPAKMSPYASLVGLFPDQILKDLGIDVQFRARRTSSYTPVIRGGRHIGLHVESKPTHLTADSFQLLTGSQREYDTWQSFNAQLGALAQTLAPTLLEPLPDQATLRQRVEPRLWSEIVEEPLGRVVEERFADDVVRGLVASDGLIGTFADLHDPDLQQNRCFLYHRIGNGTGEWRVPIGGMGALSSSIERAVWRFGGEVVTNAFVAKVESDGTTGQVTYQVDGSEHTVACSYVLGNVSPWVLDLMLGENPGPRPEGAQVTINMVLDRLPRLRAGVSPPMAFAGTMHIAESYEQLQQSFLEAQEGFIPETPPGELFCHSLTDPSVLGPLAMEGKHAFSYLGLNAPARLFSGNVDGHRDEIVLRVLDVMNVYLEEPIESLISLDVEGNPCLRAYAPQDVESALAMPGGHIFHGPLSWPWADGRTPLDTPAQRWGVQSSVANVMLCGAGGVRGGSVSGIGGHNAAMAVLESVGRPG